MCAPFCWPSFPDSRKDQGILHGWLIHVISEFLDRLDKSLCDVREGREMSNILEQCMDFGMSLGRVGVDFRGAGGNDTPCSQKPQDCFPPCLKSTYTCYFLRRLLLPLQLLMSI